jgi:hypothetical protein
MKTTIDDLPGPVLVSSLVASGQIGRDARSTVIRFSDDGIEYGVGVLVQPLPAGGFWAKFKCPRCNGGAQRLRLLDDAPACGKCCRASGLIYRSQATRTEQRHAVTAPKRIARLNGGGPFRVHQPGRKVALRARVEAALCRSVIVTRQFAHDEFAERVKRLSRT